MDLAAVMTEIAARLAPIAGLRVFAYPPGSLQPPAAVVTYPLDITCDATYGRGSDRMTLPVVLTVGKATERAARDELGEYCNGAGPRSVKALLESGTYDTFDDVRVTKIDFDAVSIGGLELLAAVFNLDIIGPGTE